uniref:Uncharacterized protein n=1 Tax=Lygus hesperus TaxID=30085 RepID=A0A0A9YX47_LYGHE
MGSINSSITKPKLAVASGSSEKAPCMDNSTLRSSDSGGFIIELWFSDQDNSDQKHLEGDKMKRAAGRSDREFIDDLQNDRFVDRELSSAVFRDYVQKAVEARMEFNRKLDEAGIANPNGGIVKVPKLTDSDVGAEESELNQWLTESDTSENLLSHSSDITDAAASGVHPETVHST